MLDICVPANAPPVTLAFPEECGLRDTRDALYRVCRAALVTPSAMRSVSRKAALARPRQVFCWLAHRKLHRSLPKIGQYLGRDHTTVLHAVRRVDRAIWEGDSRFTNIIAEAMKGDA